MPVWTAIATSKQGQLAALLLRDEGATLDQMIALTGWLPHTMRAALPCLGRAGQGRAGQGSTIGGAPCASFDSVTQPFNTKTSMGRLMLQMLLSFAQFEREVGAERVRDKIAASKAQGDVDGRNRSAWLRFCRPPLSAIVSRIITGTESGRLQSFQLETSRWPEAD